MIRSGLSPLLQNGSKGLEKESLRIDAGGRIANTPHPKALGSALTHDSITTDYSESLIELITPPYQNGISTLESLGNLHRFVYEHLGDEILLACSIPIGIQGDASIPIAEYGRSNIGQMKHIYRRGLAHRYGKTMQAIAGLHFNFSFQPELWPALMEIEADRGTLRDYTDSSYFGVVRNVHRYGWILIYLFGSSPVVPKDFFHDTPEMMSRFDALDAETLALPYATSLRMSDIGYRNDSQTTLEINFDSLADYVRTLGDAIQKKHDPYTRIGIKIDGEYRQLNDNILQIENEYYSLIRPKQVAQSGEKPTLALRKRGVRYLELRAMDLQCHQPDGIGEEALVFLEAFVVWCLMREAPPITREALRESSRNHLRVACCGRTPGLMLSHQGEEILLSQWAKEILSEIEVIARILDEGSHEDGYLSAVKRQMEKAQDPTLTPSSRILETLKSEGASFHEYALEVSRQHALYWRSSKLESELRKGYVETALRSTQRQIEIENSDQVDLDAFLRRYQEQS